MGKATICICENKGADQLRGVTAKLISAFVSATRIVQFLFYLNPKVQASLACFCACTGRFVSDMVGNHIVGFPTRRLISYRHHIVSQNPLVGSLGAVKFNCKGCQIKTVIIQNAQADIDKNIYHIKYFSVSVCNISDYFAIKKYQNHFNCVVIVNYMLNEPHREKTGFLPMRKQRRRSASR